MADVTETSTVDNAAAVDRASAANPAIIKVQEPSMLYDEDGDDYIQTTAHNNYVSRTAVLDGAHHVELKGRCVVRDGVRLRGDLAPLRMGRYGWLDSRTVVQPPPLLVQLHENQQPQHQQQTDHATTTTTTAKIISSKQHYYVPVTIGSHTVIGPDCVLEAAAVGSLCWIGRGVTIGARSIVKDCCVVAAHTTIPTDTVIPPFTRVSNTIISGSSSSSSSNNARVRLVMTPLPPSVAVELQERAVEAFQGFCAIQKQRQQQRKR